MVRNIRTADYPEERRLALGNAVAAARRHAGFRWRTDMCRSHSQVSVSSLKLVEQGKSGIGQLALSAIAGALAKHFDTWTEDTPRKILEGGDPPPLEPRGQVGVSPVITASPHEPEFWVALRTEVEGSVFDRLWDMYQEGKRAQQDLRERDSL